MKEDLNKYKAISYLWNERLNIVKMAVLPNKIYRFNTITRKPNGLFCRYGKARPESRMEMQGTQNNFEKEKQS